MNDFSSVDEALETMEGAAGSADREMEIIKQSWDYKINALKETWVGTLQELVKRKDVGNIIDFLTNVSTGIGNIVSNLGLLKTALIGVVTVIGSKKLGYKYSLYCNLLGSGIFPCYG